MATEVRMPRQGNTVESCLLISWKKKIGDQVSEGETLCEVETDKATFEVPAPKGGTILAVLRKEGDDVPVLDLIAVIGVPGEDISSIVSGAGTRASEDSVTAPRAGAQPSMAVPASGHPWPRADSQPSAAASVPRRRGSISPRARRLAEAEGIDASMLTGTGPGGRVIERDVRAALDSRATQKADSPERGSGTASSKTLRTFVGESAPEPVTEIPVRGMRKLIAERMHGSLSSTAQLTMDMSADASKILAYRAAIKASPMKRDLYRITINDMVMFAAARTLRAFPEMNAHFLGDRILRFAGVHLAFAVDTPRGLVAPVIRDAHALSLRVLSAEAWRLADAALSGKIAPEELAGGTFTVTNLGGLGVERFTPVLNPPQAAILGVCAIIPRATEVEGEVKLVSRIGLSLTIDHQAVDGAPAARFLSALCAGIAHFDLLLAE
jgi:pyruvate dehydrogenase E2 component (dihydrolipoamide acetyltransferase)